MKVKYKQSKFFLLEGEEEIEIINPNEVLPIAPSLRGGLYWIHTDLFTNTLIEEGDTFDLPENIEWEITVPNHKDCGSKGENCKLYCHSVCEKIEDPKQVIRLKLKSENEKKEPITFEKLKEVKEALVERGIGALKIIENCMLADDVVVVSSKMYKALKNK